MGEQGGDGGGEGGREGGREGGGDEDEEAGEEASMVCVITSGSTDEPPSDGGGGVPSSAGAVSNTSPEDESAFSLKAALDGTLVFLRGLSRVWCSSLGLSCSAFFSPAMSRLRLGGGAGALEREPAEVYMVGLAASICLRALKWPALGDVLSERSSAKSPKGGRLLGGGGGVTSSTISRARASTIQSCMFTFHEPTRCAGSHVHWHLSHVTRSSPLCCLQRALRTLLRNSKL